MERLQSGQQVGVVVFRAPDDAEVAGHAYVVWVLRGPGGELDLRVDDDSGTRAVAKLRRELLQAHRLIRQLAGAPGARCKHAT